MITIPTKMSSEIDFSEKNIRLMKEAQINDNEYVISVNLSVLKKYPKKNPKKFRTKTELKTLI